MSKKIKGRKVARFLSVVEKAETSFVFICPSSTEFDYHHRPYVRFPKYKMAAPRWRLASEKNALKRAKNLFRGLTILLNWNPISMFYKFELLSSKCSKFQMENKKTKFI